MSGIEKLNTTLGSAFRPVNSNQSVQASALIGHGVMIPGSKILAAGKEARQTTPFGVELQQAVDKVTATITDNTGKVVKTLDLGAPTAQAFIALPGMARMTDGTTAPDGSL